MFFIVVSIIRPPPMQRDTISAWVQCCSFCGYCSNKIDDDEGVKTTLIERKLITFDDFRRHVELLSNKKIINNN